MNVTTYWSWPRAATLHRLRSRRRPPRRLPHRLGRPCEEHLLTWRRRPVNPPATCRQPRADATSTLPATWPPSSTGAFQRSRPRTQVRCPGLRAFHQRCMPIPSGATTWQSDPNLSPTSPTKSKITPANMTPSRTGHHHEVTRAPPSSAKSPCGGPPTASIPKTRDQPEEANSKRSRPSRNNASTGISPVPARRTPDHRRRARPVLLPRGVQPSSTLPNPALLSDQGPGSARPNGVCPRFAAGRAAVWVSAPRCSGGRRLLN
jgi:hypothetical protein